MDPKFIVIDLFCGAGGTTTGFANTKGVAKVIACVNHDPKAIKSHWLNHPDVLHFEEDIRTLDLTDLILLVNSYRKRYPNAKLILWASLECTNYSKAKGGLQRDGDSRTLALHLFRYQHALNPDYIQIENVVEFMAWGPLKAKVFKSEEDYEYCQFEYKTVMEPVVAETGLFEINKDGSCVFVEEFKPVFLGIPDSMRNGIDWTRWRDTMKSLTDFKDDWRELNSADFGAYTSRNRLFGVFAKSSLPIAWPEPTHAKNPSNGMLFDLLKKWKPVREVLNTDNEGPSYFVPGRITAPKTHWRVLGGLRKFCVSPTKPESGRFIMKYHGTGSNVRSMADIGPTLDCGDRCASVSTKWIDMQFSGGGQHSDINDPAQCITTVPKHRIYTAQFINEQYGNSIGHEMENATGAVLANPKQNLVTAFIVNPQYSNNGSSVNEVAPTVIASQKARPLSLAQARYYAGHIDELPDFIKIDGNQFVIEVYETDCEPLRLIKEFMAQNGIIDIRMRMLFVEELLLIQGFPPSYQLLGNQTDKKKFIGNSVHPIIPERWTLAIAEELEFNNPFRVAA